jgi:phage terminase large subunit-like protein
LTTFPPDVRTGALRPRLEVTPPRVSSAGSEAVDLCRSAGFFLDEWQQWVLEQALGERDDGKWSALEVGLLVPRQNGKGAVLMARMLAGLFLFEEELVIYSAHLYSTSSETFLRIKSLVENSDHLRKRCKKPRTSHGEEGIELLNGNRLRFLARTKGGGRGFSGDCVVLDEAFNLPAAMMSAMFPAMSARDNPQIWYTTTPPQEFDPPSRQIRSVRHRAVSGVQCDRLAYYEWSCEPGVDPDDRAMWAQSNPALNIRVSEEFIESERAAIPPEQWVVERLGVFEEGEGIGGVISTIQWSACTEPASQLRGPWAFAFDVSLDHSWASIGI